MPEQEPQSGGELAESRLTPEQQEQVEQLRQEIEELTPDLDAGKPEAFSVLSERITALDELLVSPEQRQTPERAEIPTLEETIQQNQEMYDWLGIEINLQQELEQGNILLPSKEQREAAEREGYTKTLIITGSLSREQIINQVQTKYAQEFNSDGVWLSDLVRQDLNQTEQAEHSNRPNQPYLIYLKPQSEVSDAHPETMGKSAQECLEILNQKQKDYPNLNLKGLTLEEYLLAQAHTYQTQQKHLEEKDWSWLLEEQTKDRQGQPARCLRAGWDFRAHRLGVYSRSVSICFDFGGARFAALPAEASAKAGVPSP